MTLQCDYSHSSNEVIELQLYAFGIAAGVEHL